MPEHVEAATGNFAAELNRMAQIGKATKADDAEVPFFLWNDRISNEKSFEFCELPDTKIAEHLDSIRKGALRFWKRKVARDFWSWWKRDCDARERRGEPPCHKSLEAGLAAIDHAVDASWWNWDRGSAPFFW